MLVSAQEIALGSFRRVSAVPRAGLGEAIRRSTFNAAFRERYGSSPVAIRKAARERLNVGDAGREVPARRPKREPRPVGLAGAALGGSWNVLSFTAAVRPRQFNVGYRS